MDETQGPEQPTSTPTREVPPLLAQAWGTATGDGDPLLALGATRALRAHLSTWEAQLVGEAVADGATWETIGSSVGVSRQAAWQRFHHEAHDFRRQWKSEFNDLRNKHRDEMMELRDRLKGESRSRRRPTREGRRDIV